MRIAGPVVPEIVAVAAVEALADEEALFVLVEDEKGVEHEEAAVEAVAAWVGVLHEVPVDETRTAVEDTAEEAADIAAWEDILEPNMNTDPWLLEHTAFVQKHKKLA